MDDGRHKLLQQLLLLLQSALSSLPPVYSLQITTHSAELWMLVSQPRTLTCAPPQP